jgi:hypothetical protein
MIEDERQEFNAKRRKRIHERKANMTEEQRKETNANRLKYLHDLLICLF